MSDMRIRPARAGDLDAINEIYHHSVLHSTCTYQTEPWTPDERSAWFSAHDAKHPITVAVVDEQIAGWGALSRFHQRCAYGRTVEDSVYVRPDMLRRGIGSALLSDLIARGRSLAHHTIIAVVDSSQAASIALHDRVGFQACGHLREVGYKFDRWLDVLYMQLLL